ncbi:MAG TPA: hypothetical protein VNA28_00555 [Solirubrobacteraceae bacterium]|nr:hypothetical protein [Solirubrobacteraceae bacterium]
MLFEELVAQVGEERYSRACEIAWSTGAGTGRCSAQRSWPGDLELVPHEFADAWWHDDEPLLERLQMGLRLYRDMPCYASTMELKSFYEHFGTEEKLVLWEALRAVLDSDDDRLADPMTYALWVDFFEDVRTVEEAWHETTRRDREPWGA